MGRERVSNEITCIHPLTCITSGMAPSIPVSPLFLFFPRIQHLSAHQPIMNDWALHHHCPHLGEREIPVTTVHLDPTPCCRGGDHCDLNPPWPSKVPHLLDPRDFLFCGTGGYKLFGCHLVPLPPCIFEIMSSTENQHLGDYMATEHSLKGGEKPLQLSRSMGVGMCADPDGAAYSGL
ncbi:UNVERIFIED_CONTAM: hypothetical protein K2H54_036508 [Gekko kuhli]